MFLFQIQKNQNVWEKQCTLPFKMSISTHKSETLSRFTFALLNRCKLLQISSLLFFSCPLCDSSCVCSPVTDLLVLPSHSKVSLLGSKDRSHCELGWYGRRHQHLETILFFFSMSVQRNMITSFEFKLV